MARRNPWFEIGIAVFAPVCVVVASGVAYWTAVNQLPSYVPPPVVLPVPNAYDDYASAAAMCRAAGGSSVGRGPKFAYEAVPLEHARAVVARNRAALARLRQGFGKQYCAPPVVSLHQAFPEIGGLLELARVLVAEGKLAEREGRLADAARIYGDCLRLGVDVPRGGVLIHGFVGLRIQSMGLRALEESIDRLDGPTAVGLVRVMSALDRRAIGFADTLAGEKEATTAGMLDLFRHATAWAAAFPDDSPLFHMLIGLQYGFPSKRAVLANYRSYMDAGIADARKPHYARAALPPVPRDPLNQFLAPDFTALKWR